MIKQILLIFFLILISVSCGKKGDPIYKESKLFDTETIIIS